MKPRGSCRQGRSKRQLTHDRKRKQIKAKIDRKERKYGLEAPYYYYPRRFTRNDQPLRPKGF
jgi:hypothetical protein